ncbi:hypothetical protein SCRM01_236 [Synechococcus phage S-CRM01]|uniref:hypothetical protein n=1 Tax=Synechococcus phage S-CRM01 TaxID=1026955 RepID=UPI000209E43D|nr:hypothetical protein SCRM01_236 [Synechococcus phage S-CRM01]AEC53182.1 hypothetical protein SCRM01_236 [Synechococcus phage S-CRM01]
MSYVAIKDSYQTNARGDVKVIKAGDTITPAQYRKLNEFSKAKFQEVVKTPKAPKASKVKVTKVDELERLAKRILAELRVEHQLATSTVDYSPYSNVLPGWGVEITDPKML